MDRKLQIFRIFIASPGDLGDERSALRGIVEKINEIYSKETDIRIELLGWEDTMPGAGRPQSLINSDLDKADLFIGCVWKRWGSLSGNGSKTGFEEEFDRALERKESTGSPEMWLFFKEIEPTTLEDPGEQLKKVLEFRSREIQAKRLLFKEFQDVSEWRELVSDLLHRNLLRLVGAQHTAENKAQTPTSSSPNRHNIQNDKKNKPGSKVENTEAIASLLILLKDVNRVLEADEFSDRSRSLAPEKQARLLLLAATYYDWHSQHIEIGSHEINSIYLCRDNLKITPSECVFLLRTIILDSSLTKPGWLWIKRLGLKPEKWLPWFACFDSDERMRETTIDLATFSEFSLQRKSKDSPRPMDSLLCDESATVRKAALRHLAALGKATDTKAIGRLLQDDDKQIRGHAELAQRRIRLRVEPDKAIQESIERGDGFDEEFTGFVSERAEELSEATLLSALRHPSGSLRAMASAELLRRGDVPIDVVSLLCSDDAKLVREHGYLARISGSEFVDVSEIRTALTDSPYDYSRGKPTWNSADPDRVILAYFGELSLEEQWKLVELLDTNSHIALRAAGRGSFVEVAERIRGLLSDNFQQWSNNNQASPASLLFGNDHIIGQLRVAALHVLASNGDPVDRDLFLKFLSDDGIEIKQDVECLRGLARAGHAGDLPRIGSLLDSMFPHIQAAATRAYLAVSPNAIVAIKDILGEPSAYRIWVVISHAFESKGLEIWDLLEPLLRNEDDNIRRLICYYAIKMKKPKALEKLLGKYLASGAYYYNVVTILDRVLYAPNPIRKMYMSEENEFFEGFKPSATMHWDELILDGMISRLVSTKI